jgi:ribosomal peptide maturation radical SAM protein 1
MSYRHKSPNRVFNELMHLSSEYKCLQFYATDNILATDYFEHLLPRLAEFGSDIALFFEVKANLKRDQIALLHASGINRIQPGIESFNTRLLKNMQKGVTAIQNIQLLKWCHEFKIRPGYNVLHGFPGEKPGDYKDLACIFQKLSHLQPPDQIAKVEFERFSPFFYERERFGLTLKPQPAYEFIFPKDRVRLDRIAYFFRGEFAGDGDSAANINKAKSVWANWKEFREKRDVSCTVEHGPDFLRIYDNRPRIAGSSPRPQSFYLGAKLRAIYLFCDENRSFRSILDKLSREFHEEIAPRQLQKWLDALELHWLIFREGDRYISLATRKDGPWLGREKPISSRAIPNSLAEELVQLS